MKFISIRDFRSDSSEIIGTGEDYVLTNHGKPTALVVPINENNFEETLAAVRQAKALHSLASLQAQAKARGLDKLSMEEIDKIIDDTRKARKRRK